MAFHNKRHYNPNVVPKKREGVAPDQYWVFAKRGKRIVALWVDPTQTAASLERDLALQLSKVDGGEPHPNITLWIPTTQPDIPIFNAANDTKDTAKEVTKATDDDENDETDNADVEAAASGAQDDDAMKDDDVQRFIKIESTSPMADVKSPTYEWKEGAYLIYTIGDEEPSDPDPWSPKIPDLSLLPNPPEEGEGDDSAAANSSSASSAAASSN